MFRPRNHNLSDITDTVLASRATKEILAVQELGNGNGGLCLILKKVDSQQRVNNVSFTHRETAEVL